MLGGVEAGLCCVVLWVGFIVWVSHHVVIHFIVSSVIGIICEIQVATHSSVPGNECDNVVMTISQ